MRCIGRGDIEGRCGALDVRGDQEDAARLWEEGGVAESARLRLRLGLRARPGLWIALEIEGRNE